LTSDNNIKKIKKPVHDPFKVLESGLHPIKDHSKPNGLFGEVGHDHIAPAVKLRKKTQINHEDN